MEAPHPPPRKFGTQPSAGKFAHGPDKPFSDVVEKAMASLRFGLMLALVFIIGYYAYFAVYTPTQHISSLKASQASTASPNSQPNENFKATVWLKRSEFLNSTALSRKQILPSGLQVTFNIDNKTNKILSQSIDDPSLLKPEITVVTAYFNIGSFAKGQTSNVHTPSRYMQWMKVFGRIRNNLVAYTDSRDAFNLLTNLRRKFPSNMTKVFLIDRANLWSFSLAGEIRSIYSQPNYPHHHPNTVNENYSCAMHAKFELVNKVLMEELFPTKYFCWLDIGLFRALADDNSVFKLQIPHEWDRERVAYSRVYGFNDKATIESVIKGNSVWVGGAMFLGTPEVLHKYTEDYMNTVKMLLKQRLMNTDQQVIYSMYLPSSRVKPRVQIQLFSGKNSRYNPWFYLGYLCRETTGQFRK
ncbi:uncharacterized protein LOC124147819 isoform X2 [Haliotis rufescens]|uniref:uncharacterized protein LOC124147819 isoform X2 n=1 Tax=Haliotis rufescens TaxID=6454 RepID=UPI00201EDF7D|nr:uncharacterized protein LOC124147819 isoform X2 [Haliotis rufescens]